MKKKLMMVTVLLGALAFGACVDDNESASVTAVRDAKAKQLESVAAMNNATAEATKKLAEANAALIAAQTEAAKIEAEMAAVEVEIAKVQLESEKARLESQLAQLEVDKANAKAEMERIAAELEVDLQNTKAQLLAAQFQYNNNLAQLDKQEQEKLGKLLTTYTKASTDLLNAQQKLANDKIALASLETGLVTAKEQAQKDSLDLYEDIAYQQAQIDAYKQYESTSTEEALEAYQKVSNEYKVVEDKYRTAAQAWYWAIQETNANEEKFYKTEYRYKLEQYFKEKTHQGITITLRKMNNGKPWNQYAFNTTDPNTNITTWTAVFTDSIVDNKYMEWTNEDDVYETTGPDTCPTILQYFELNEEGFAAYFAAVQKAIDDNQVKAYNTAKAAYEAAKTAEATAKTAAEADGATDVEKDAYYAAQRTTQTALEKMNAYEEEKKEAEEELAKLKEVYDELVALKDDVKQKVDDYNAALLVQEETYVAKNIALHNVKMKDAEVNAAWAYYIGTSYYDGTISVKELIAACEGKIATYEQRLANLSNYTTKEQAIEAKKVDIANDEATVAVREKEAAAAKAALDAAMTAK